MLLVDFPCPLIAFGAKNPVTTGGPLKIDDGSKRRKKLVFCVLERVYQRLIINQFGYVTHLRLSVLAPRSAGPLRPQAPHGEPIRGGEGSRIP